MASESMNHGIKARFEEDGFAVVQGFVGSGEVARINTEIDRYVAEVVPGIPPEAAFYETKGDPSTLKQLPRISEYDAFFRQFHTHDRMRDLASLVLGCAVVPRDAQWFDKPPGIGGPTPAHQDGFYDRIVPVEMVNMWLALDPVEEENGCVRYVTGSHRDGLREHARTNTLGFSQGLVGWGPDDEAREVAVCAQPGDMLVHHGLTVHRADGNASDRHRRAIGSVYYAAHVKRDEEHWKTYRRDLTRDLVRKGKL